jgi:hypothetical protein
VISAKVGERNQTRIVCPEEAVKGSICQTPSTGCEQELSTDAGGTLAHVVLLVVIQYAFSRWYRLLKGSIAQSVFPRLVVRGNYFTCCCWELGMGHPSGRLISCQGAGVQGRVKYGRVGDHLSVKARRTPLRGATPFQQPTV